jgi:hypothetical protein
MVLNSKTLDEGSETASSNVSKMASGARYSFSTIHSSVADSDKVEPFVGVAHLPETSTCSVDPAFDFGPPSISVQETDSGSAAAKFSAANSDKVEPIVGFVDLPESCTSAVGPAFDFGLPVTTAQGTGFSSTVPQPCHTSGIDTLFEFDDVPETSTCSMPAAFDFESGFELSSTTAQDTDVNTGIDQSSASDTANMNTFSDFQYLPSIAAVESAPSYAHNMSTGSPSAHVQYAETGTDSEVGMTMDVNSFFHFELAASHFDTNLGSYKLIDPDLASPPPRTGSASLYVSPDQLLAEPRDSYDMFATRASAAGRALDPASQGFVPISSSLSGISAAGVGDSHLCELALHTTKVMSSLGPSARGVDPPLSAAYFDQEQSIINYDFLPGQNLPTFETHTTAAPGHDEQLTSQANGKAKTQDPFWDTPGYSDQM